MFLGMIYLFDVLFLEMASGCALSTFQGGHRVFLAHAFFHTPTVDNLRSTFWLKRTLQEWTSSDNDKTTKACVKCQAASLCYIYKTFSKHSKQRKTVILIFQNQVCLKQLPRIWANFYHGTCVAMAAPVMGLFALVLRQPAMTPPKPLLRGYDKTIMVTLWK